MKLKDILEKEVDKKYYLEDKQVERIKNATFNSENRRIQEKDYCDTLLARDYKDPKCVQVGSLYGKGQAGRVYDKNGLSPTLDTCAGGNRMPITVVKDSFVERHYKNFFNKNGYVPEHFNPYHEKDCSKEALTQTTNCGCSTGSGTVLKYEKNIGNKVCAFCGKPLQRKQFKSKKEGLKAFRQRKYCDRLCMRKAYLKMGENEQSYSNAHTTARKINELFFKKENCEICGKQSENGSIDIHHKDGNYKNNNPENLMALCRSCHMKVHRNTDKTCKICGGKHKGLGYCNKHYIRFKKYGDPLYTKVNVKENNNNQTTKEKDMGDKDMCEYRIRKLTPKEVWRLMAFSDEDFDKAKQRLIKQHYNGRDRADSQLYKMAGNSIVVKVLEEIFNGVREAEIWNE